MKYHLLPLLLALSFFACENGRDDASANTYNIIPQPVSLTAKAGKFQINADTKILLGNDDLGLRTAAQHLANMLGAVPTEGEPAKDAIYFQLDPSIESEEGYELTVTPFEIEIRAKTGAGAFYAVQTLMQLIPLDAKRSFSIPCVEISDAPRYGYRGMHLDVGRHFYPVDFVKKYIDLLALHKYNNFHWHLTEDQGWRIEIKKYPKLQEIAACRSETLIGHYNDQPQQYDGVEYCGHYTQDEAREIVQYAADRFITVIPEIEMPGHAQAAIAAYPELGCTGQQIPVMTKWGISDQVYCPNEATFEFLENVLLEVMDIFPSKYIHIGGDECPKTQWKESRFCQDLIRKKRLDGEHGLQSYFIQRMEKFINEQGRQIIGWDEILEGGLAPNATVMSWRGTEGGIEAAKQRHDVIMTPTDFCYFDYYQSQDPDEPLAIGGYLPLEKVYSYEPTPSELTPEEAKHILGAQGNLWSEYLPETSLVEYMVFPRACALAEVTWSPKEARNYDDFVSRLAPHLKRLDAMGVNAANKIFDVKTSVQAGDGKGVWVSLSPKMEGIDLRYTLDGSEPTARSDTYSEPISIEKSGVLKASSFEGEQAIGQGSTLEFTMHKAAGKAIQLTNSPKEKYSGNGPGSIINGIFGSNDRYGGTEWLGFEGKDFEAVIDLGEKQKLTKAEFRFFNGKGQWIYPPKFVSIAVSDDGLNFFEMGLEEVTDSEGKIIETTVPLLDVEGRFVKIFVKRFGLIPDGAQGAGHEAWLFIDEIVVD